MFARLYNTTKDKLPPLVHRTQAWIGVLAMKTRIEEMIGPFFAEAREEDLNDVRVLESTIVDGPARDQPQMWVTRYKIDDKTDRGVSRGRID